MTGPTPAPDAPALRWGRRAAGLVFVALATALIWGPHTGWVYPEWQQYAFDAGTHGGGASEVAHAYTHSFLGWYRPTSFFLAPYLLRVDYFNPTDMWVVNLVFLGLVGAALCLLLPRPRLGAMVVAGVFVVGSSVLFYVPYAPQVDSLYVLFSIAFVALALRLNSGATLGVRLRALPWLGLLLTWFLAVTSKEIAVAVPLVALAFLLMQPARLTRAAVWRALRITAPFLLMSAVYAAVYVRANLQSGNLDPNHTARPGLAKLHSVRDMLFWGLGFRAPGSQRPNWQFQFDRWFTLLALLALAAGVAGLVIACRRVGARRIVLFVLTYLGLAGVVGLFGSLPYHAFPLVALVGVGLVYVLTAALQELDGRGARVALLAEVCLVAVALAQVAVARHVATRSVDEGPQTAFLRASTELLEGHDLDAVRAARDPLLVFEDCLGMASDPLHYFARASSGTQLVVPNLTAAASTVDSATAAAASAHRPVFVARCTGHADPWYTVTESPPG